MATDDDSGLIAANAIREWARAMAGAASLDEAVHANETFLIVAPKNPKACPVEFRISPYGTFSVYAGAGFAFEEVELTLERLRELCEAVGCGRVIEQVWEWRGTTVKTKGYIELASGRMRDSCDSHWVRLFGLGTCRTIEYEPYLNS
jgi:hypothetical protein